MNASSSAGCRAGHPLQGARSLQELSSARWVMSASAPSDTRLPGLFKKHRMPMPEHVTFGNNILSQMVAVLDADMLAMVPRQWLEFPLMAGHIERIPIKEVIDSPSIVMIRRATLPLTPAAEYFCDLIRRASARMPGKAGRRPASRSRKSPVQAG